MTEQEIFDKVVLHLYQQGEPSITHGGRCRYRLSGKMCAIGCLIPDDMYSESMEGGVTAKYVASKLGDKIEIPDELLEN